MGVSLEHLTGQYDKLIEIVSSIKKTVDNQPTREEFRDLKADVKTIKNVVTITNHDMIMLDRRVTQLEAV